MPMPNNVFSLLNTFFLATRSTNKMPMPNNVFSLLNTFFLATRWRGKKFELDS